MHLFTVVVIGSLTLAIDACTELFLQQPEPVIAPIGSRLELTCRVATGQRVVWQIQISRGGGSPVLIESPNALEFVMSASIGFETEISSVQNPEPPLFINGIVGSENITVKCISVDIMVYNDR